jgi:VIT1/CCC1 family predicted Fe2+/Mn2+ transporter
MTDHKEMLIPMLLSAFFGGSTASMAAVKRRVSAGQALIAVGISSIVSASLPWALVAVGCHWGLATLGSAVLGLLIFGFIATTDKASDEYAYR